MKKNIFIFLMGSVFFTSCFTNKEKPNYQYMGDTDMYEPVGYETYYPSYQNGFENGMQAQLPASNTIKRGWMPYEYENTEDGYQKALLNLKNPLKNTVNSSELKSEIQKGAELFNIYCSVCHGAEGDGQGILVKRKKFMGIPNFKDREITEGSIYHTIYYGKNNMGSFSSQLTEKERWQVALYVEQLREKLKK